MNMKNISKNNDPMLNLKETELHRKVCKGHVWDIFLRKRKSEWEQAYEKKFNFMKSSK